MGTAISQRDQRGENEQDNQRREREPALSMLTTNGTWKISSSPRLYSGGDSPSTVVRLVRNMARQHPVLSPQHVASIHEHHHAIHGDSGHADHSDDGYRCQIPAQHSVTEYRVHDREKCPDHGDRRLPIATQERRHDRVHRDQDDGNLDPRCRQHRSFVPGAAFGFDPQTRSFCKEARHELGVEVPLCLNRRNDRGIGLRVHDRRLPTIDPL